MKNQMNKKFKMDSVFSNRWINKTKKIVRATHLKFSKIKNAEAVPKIFYFNILNDKYYIFILII